VLGEDGGAVALVIRGDHELNAVKAEKLPGVARPLRMAGADAVKAATGCEPGFVGPVGLQLKVYADHAALATADFVCGANEPDAHLVGVNWGRDLPRRRPPTCATSSPAIPSPDGKGRLEVARGIEVGSHLPARPQVQRVDGRAGARRGGARAVDGDGLLRHRRHAPGGRRHRAALRRAWHRLA
jgi:prolyl-tRNA synthetase